MDGCRRHYRAHPAWVIWLGMVASLTGCDRLVDLANQPGLSTDLTELLTRSDISNASLRCEMMHGTRDARADLLISAAELNRLIQDVGMSERQSAGTERRLPWQLPQAAGRCPLVRSWVNDVPGIRLYSIAERPETLRFNSGRNFEYLFLFRRESTGEASVFVCYWYGCGYAAR